jgi:hypothetical protein
LLLARPCSGQLGAPFFAEGSPDGMLDALALIGLLSDRHRGVRALVRVHPDHHCRHAQPSPDAGVTAAGMPYFRTYWRSRLF